MTSIGDFVFDECDDLILYGKIGSYADTTCRERGLIPFISLDDPNVFSGTCGDALTWALEKNGTLMVSGTGEMKAYAFSSNKAIRTISVEDGVTAIGSGAFYGCDLLTSVTLPDGVTSIKDHAFYYCKKLTTVNIPESVTEIGKDAFKDCPALTIHGKSGSYAKENNLRFIADESPETQPTESAATTEATTSTETTKTTGTTTTTESATATDTLTTEPVTRLGDVDGDGEITLVDVIIIERYIVGGWNVELDESIADVDQDGEVTLVDWKSTIPQSMAAGWI